MNHCEPLRLSGRVRGALHRLSFVVLPALAASGLAAPPLHPVRPPDRPRADPRPYLMVAGAPPLRFEEPTPPPDLMMRPPAAAPPMPALTPTESSVALANAAAAQSTPVAPETPPAPPPPPVASTPAAPPSPPKTPEPAPAPVKSPPPILRDELSPAVRPEDFLPYFQIPGAAQQPNDVTLLVPAPQSAPAPAPLPPSSATYSQTPK